MKKIFNITSTLVIALLVVALMLFVAPRFFGIKTFAVQSESMSPEYNVGDLLYVKPVDMERLQVGDVITFVINEDLMVATHRVVDIDMENELVYTKGDANEQIDERPVRFGNIVGRVEFALPYFGSILRVVTEERAVVLVLLVSISALMLLANGLVRKNQEKHRKNQKKHGIVLLLFLALGAIRMEGTLAFFTDTAQATVSISAGTVPESVYALGDNIDIEIEDVEYRAQAKSQIRVMIVPQIEDVNGQPSVFLSETRGQPMGLQMPNANGDMVLGDIILHLHSDWETYWSFQDGFFYHRQPLQPGESPAMLLNGASIRQDSALVYRNYRVMINVLTDTAEIEL